MTNEIKQTSLTPALKQHIYEGLAGDTLISSESLSPNWISNYLAQNFSGLNILDAWGEKSFFYNPENLLKRGIYFCTIKEKNGANDQSSDLNRTDVFRINFGLSKKTFLNIFKILPKRAAKGNAIDGPYNFKELDILMPHPVYGWMAWVSILNPSTGSWNRIEVLIAESYQLSVQKYSKKQLKCPKI